MLFGETVAVYCENHTEHINTLYGQNAEFSNLNAHRTYSRNCAIKVRINQIPPPLVFSIMAGGE
jgi:hypothetical protein